MSENNNELTVEVKEKIKLEKRKRHQAYMALDYLLSPITYYDFFTVDTFEILKKSSHIAQKANKKNLTSEFLMLSFFEIESEICNILNAYNVTRENLTTSLENINGIKLSTKSEPFFKNFLNFRGQKTNFKDQRLKFNIELNLIFKKCAYNALHRFKTPVISSEILLLTLLEEKYTCAGKLLLTVIKTELDWFLLRYKILKKLHNHETKIRSEVSKNQQYFAYLLKIELTDLEFEKLLQKNLLSTAVSTFRNLLIFDVLQKDIFTLIDEEIKMSIKISNTRTYSK